MGRIILAVSFLVTAGVQADTYDADFAAQIKKLTIKVEAVGDDIQVKKVGVEDLEAMLLRVEG